ncbi:MAG TPA: alpha/beta hydrolase [Mycobacteriales bacterium]|jgi:pimeloyl-ACP methyl ester carboxylesterase|nr:alpha/beta hydrolase [Mycobacteriales bacterium]
MTTNFLDRPTGRLAYERSGDPDGPLVVLSPGMGDVRSTYRELAAALAADGANVVTADLRGHGESSTGWDDGYSVSAVADDLLALLREHGGRGVLVGNSYSGSAAVVAAAREPQAVTGLVLSGAFVREHKASAVNAALFSLFTHTFPGRPLWTAYAWPSFFKRRPADFAARKAELKANLARPHGYDALAWICKEGSHAGTEQQLGRVQAPALVVMGSKDPDFPDPAVEARYTADSLAGPAEVMLVDGVGHYPHTEAADVVVPEVVAFVRKVS